jgi:hypothetical protein
LKSSSNSQIFFLKIGLRRWFRRVAREEYSVASQVSLDPEPGKGEASPATFLKSALLLSLVIAVLFPLKAHSEAN